jgi:hypothetical protein
MKTIWLFSILALVSLRSLAQSGEIFTYDHERVQSVMDQITRESVTSLSRGFDYISDTLSMAHKQKPFWTGYLGGCIGGVGGSLAGYVGGELMELGGGFGIGAVITGFVAGTVIPQVILSQRQAAKREHWKAAQGSLASLGTGVLLIVAFEVLEVLSTR